MIYPQMGPSDDNLDAKLKSAVGKNPITDSIVEDDVKADRCAIFGAVHDLYEAAQDLYVEGEMGWDEVMKNLSIAISKLQGKEKTFMEAHDKDEEDNKEEESIKK